MLSRSHQRVCIPVQILDDNVAEREEGFTCVLSLADSQSLPPVNLERAVTSITIEDNDGTTSVEFKAFLKEVCSLSSCECWI